MSTLRPTLWRTCRAIACPTRLSLLKAICEGRGLSVGELGRWVGISEQNASIQLRALNSRGLITAQHNGMKVIYQAEPNHAVDGAPEIMDALRVCFERKIQCEDVYRIATAFTNERRIWVVRLLMQRSSNFKELEFRSCVSRDALLRHLNKLESRHVVVLKQGQYVVGRPKNPLAKCLLDLIRAMPPARLFSVRKIISGGQTGVDRAALDAAIACDIPHGGRCPKGRRAEDGPIGLTYQLQEMDSEDYPSRTKANVADADLTLILSRGPLMGGTSLTKQIADALDKPCVVVDVANGFQGLEELPQIFPTLGNCVLNVAGPRASGDSQIYAEVFNALVRWFPTVCS